MKRGVRGGDGELGVEDVQELGWRDGWGVAAAVWLRCQKLGNFLQRGSSQSGLAQGEPELIGQST